MKILASTLGLFYFFLTAVAADILITEDFTTEYFPPAGWTIQYIAGGGLNYWNRYVESGNGCAHGYSSCNAPSINAATLISPAFTLNDTETCVIKFRRRDTTLQTPHPGATFARAELRRGTTIIWDLYLTPNSAWIWDTERIQVNQTSDQYKVGWEVSSYSDSSYPIFGHFYIDDVTIESSPLVAENTTIGNIKALFHN
jgi:hypothetical protein